MTQLFEVGDRVSAIVALPGIPLGTPCTIISVVPGLLTWCLVQPDDQAILLFGISAELLVRVALAA